MKPRHDYTLCGTVAAAALVLAAPALAGPEDNSIVVAVATDFVMADPANGTLGSDIPILYTMYDRLLDITPEDLTPRPMLATDWSWSDDQRTLTLTLREGVRFHDGTDFDAEAVKTSLEYFRESGTNLDLDNIESIEVTGPYEIALTSRTVDSSLPGLLAERAGMILSPANIEEHGREGYAQNPVGTGPFRFVEHETGSAVFVERFEDYWNPDAVHLDEIEFRVFKNPTSTVSAVMTGTLDRMGLGLKALRQRKPEIVLVEMPVFGNSGPMASHGGLGPTMEFAAGMGALTSYGDSEPFPTGPAYLDPVGGYNAAAAALTALVHRQQTGEGQAVELSQVEAAMPRDHPRRHRDERGSRSAG